MNNEPPKPKETLCQQCNKMSGLPPHPCPYGEEIHNDHKECNCCDECTYECSKDI